MKKAHQTGWSPLFEIWHLSVPGTIFGVLLADPECLPTKMVFAVQLIGVLIIEGVGEQVHPRPGVEQLKSFTNSEVYHLIALNLVWRLHVLKSSYQERTDYIQTSAKEKDFNLSSHKYPKLVCSISKKTFEFYGSLLGQVMHTKTFSAKKSYLRWVKSILIYVSWFVR